MLQIPMGKFCVGVPFRKGISLNSTTLLKEGIKRFIELFLRITMNSESKIFHSQPEMTINYFEKFLEI